MAKIAILIGHDKRSGNLTVVETAEGAGVNKLLEKRIEIRSNGGLVKVGKSEIKLTDLVCMSNNTAGGELKAKLKFEHKETQKKVAQIEAEETI